MTRTVTLRLKLTDFINTNFEKNIMERIDSIHNELHIAIILYLWVDDDVNNSELKNFLMRWEDKLKFKTIVKKGHTIKANEFIYFDILPSNLKNASYNRFTYRYNDKNKIVDGLEEFYKITKFVVSDKTIKKQKRNDYED